MLQRTNSTEHATIRYVSTCLQLSMRKAQVLILPIIVWVRIENKGVLQLGRPVVREYDRYAPRCSTILVPFLGTAEPHDGGMWQRIGYLYTTLNFTTHDDDACFVNCLVRNLSGTFNASWV